MLKVSGVSGAADATLPGLSIRKTMLSCRSCPAFKDEGKHYHMASELSNRGELRRDRWWKPHGVGRALVRGIYIITLK